MSELSCCFTGHRKLSDDFDEKKLRKSIRELIKSGYTTFYCGMAYGFDLLCGLILAQYKKKYNLKIVACIPCADQSKYFSDDDKKIYEKVRRVCDEEVVLYEKYRNGCMHERDRYMVDRSDTVIAYLNDEKSGTAYTVNYAYKKEKKIIYVSK